MQIPTELIPKCPADNSDMTTNLRVDNYFVEDEIWHKASETYYNFLEKNKNKHILFFRTWSWSKYSNDYKISLLADDNGK